MCLGFWGLDVFGVWCLGFWGLDVFGVLCLGVGV